MHLVKGLVVIDSWADTDPVLTEVHAVNLVSQIRLANMGAAVAHALDLFEVSAGQTETRVSSVTDVLGSVSQCIRKSVP